jgi:two-component system chemotaxis response regulator CheB
VAPRIIVVGASAGGIAVLQDTLARLPRAFPAIICAVVHMPPWRRSTLPSMLAVDDRPAIEPVNRQPLIAGRLYVAPSDHHLLVEPGEAVLWHGPKENSQRPSINALFRSAAIAYGAGAIGVVLSGAFEDGATGLWWIKRHGGVAIVQDPKEAEVPSMPQAAIATVDVDYCVTARELAPLLMRLTTDADPQPQPSTAGETNA